MNINNYQIKPLLLNLPDTEYWVERRKLMDEHLSSIGITDVYHVAGIHGEKFGIIGTHPYELDNPNGGHMIGIKYTASFLSQYVMYSVANAMDYTHYLFLEDDTRFNHDWKDKLTKALEDVPYDFDFLFVGSCCAIDKRPIPVKAGSSVFRFARTKGFPPKYPLGGNCFIVAKKALPHIISTQRDAYAPADINLALHSFPEMDVYAILPRICEQVGNENLPH